MSEEARLQEMIAAACLRAGSEAAFTADLRGFLESHGVDAEDVAAIMAAPPRLSLYRRLVRNNLTGVTEKILKRTRARVNALAAGSFDASFASFLDQVGPRTHHLRDVPGEFLDWVEPQWRARAGAWGDLPAWVADLARHELVEFQVAAAAVSKEPARVTEIAAGRPLVFAEAVRLMQYAFAVHELPLDIDDRSEPSPSPTSLLVYRDGENVVQVLALSPFAAAITRRLLGGAPLLDAVRDAATDVGASPGVLDVSRFLADLGERGILLGARA
ncbi:MAG: putative DNA-binding domain-containing protein [Polyangiaceae bacterium]